MKEKLLTLKPWTSVNGVKLAAAAAALQLIPENIGFLIRLQRLSAIGVSLSSQARSAKISPSNLRALLKEVIVSGPAIQGYEDPYADIYSVEFPSSRGPRLVIQGLTERSGHTAKLLLKTIFGRRGEDFDEGFRSIAAALEQVLLGLSNEMCKRGGITRGLVPLDPRPRTISVPGEDRLRKLTDAVTYSLEELSALFPSTTIPIFRMLSIVDGDALQDLDDFVDSQFIVTPFLLSDQTLVVANPGELVAALRHHLIVASDQFGCRDLFAKGFRGQVMDEASALLELNGGVKIEVDEVTCDSLIIYRKFAFTEDKFIDLFVVTDDFSDYSHDDPSGTWDPGNLGHRLQRVIDSPDDSNEADANTLRLIVFETIGRNVFIGLEAMRRQGPSLMMTLDELQVMIELDGHDPLFLWRFAQADLKLDETMNVLSWTKLDRYACYRKYRNSYYFSDDRIPTSITMSVGYGLPLRIEAQQRYDHHLARLPETSSFVMVHSLYGVDTAPIYATHTDHDGFVYLVESGGMEIWIGAPGEVDDELSSITRNILEAFAFWFWQIAERAPSLFKGATNSNGQLSIALSLTRREDWRRSLVQSPGKDFEMEWISAISKTQGSIEFGISHDGLTEMQAEFNEADRTSVRSILTVLIDLSGHLGFPLSDFLEEIAPFGNKRMLRVLSSSQILLRPGQLPPPRYLQEAVSAVVLDNLGDWLRGTGLKVGPIESGSRTEILRIVVAYLFELLESAVSELSPEGLIQYLVRHDEALVHHEATQSLIAPSRVACFGGTNQFVDELVKDHKRHVEAVVAIRFLIEYVAAKPPVGYMPITLSTFDYLLALSAELVNRGTLSDAIYHGFSESELSILESGRLGTSQEDRYHLGTEAMVFAHAAARKQSILATEIHEEIEPAFEAPSSNVDAAMLAEFGFTLKEYAHATAELVKLGDARCEEEPFELSLDEVRNTLCAALNWSQSKVSSLLSNLMLEPRNDFLSIGPAAYPWRYNREWSYIRRPLIFLRGSDGESKLIWGARRLWTSGSYWVELIYSARLRAHSEQMKSLLGKIKQRQNREFEIKVEGVLKSTDFPLTANRVTKLGRKRLLSPEGEDLGDIDVLGVHPTKKLVLVIEAKDFEMARTPSELANEALNLFRGEKSAHHKLNRRVLWIENNLPSLFSEFGINGDLKGWIVQPVIVTSVGLMTPRVFPSEGTILPIGEFAEWVVSKLRGVK